MALAQEHYEQGKRVLDALTVFGAGGATQQFGAVTRRFPRADNVAWTKSDLLQVLDSRFVDDPNYPWMRKVLKKRPIRSLSGITSITVLTKPFPCPGRCVFCPVDVRMPKSYIASEPGAQRAGRLGFDPYTQVTTRLRAYSETGHPISKIELIVLGGTWSSYPPQYQRWFVKRLFDALNDFGIRRDDESHAYDTDWVDRVESGESYNDHINASKFVQNAFDETATQEELTAAQERNETAASRCVGMSLETRPDLVDVDECVRLRSLGATKIQIGIQSMDDRILRMNKRGHLVAKTEQAITLLRSFGFKVHAHWMPNLYGSTPDGDKRDYERIFENVAIRPDELKVYPTALIQDTELEKIAAEGKWSAFAEEELNDVLTHVLTNTPEYCRLTRIIRDIPSHEILEGNKKGNLRQIVEQGIEVSKMRDIRAREIKEEEIDKSLLELDVIEYETRDSTERFLQYIRPSDRKIAAFLRLSLPHARAEHPLDELKGSAVIREVHVYGQSLDVGLRDASAQHRGLGSTLIARACEIARDAGFGNLAVISAVGTRPYYERLGFTKGGMYQHRALPGLQ